jgi:hypothetical protein
MAGFWNSFSGLQAALEQLLESQAAIEKPEQGLLEGFHN